MTDTLISPATVRAIVRERVGRRSRISRQEMAELLAALDATGFDLVAQSTITARGADGQLCVGDQWIAPVTLDDPTVPPSMRTVDAAATRAAEVRATARAWADMVRGITVVSVMEMSVRHDEPGSMHPLQHAQLSFLSASQVGREHDPVAYIRQHADRVLIVADDPLFRDLDAAERLAREAEECAREATQRSTQLRKHLQREYPERMDGTWTRLLDDGTLEIRDPNDGQSADPADKTRYQYRVDPDTGNVLTRRLPPEAVGDVWRDIGVPEWGPSRTPPRDELMYAWWESQVA